MTRQSVRDMAVSVAGHPVTPWLQLIVGLSAFGVSLYLFVVERDADKLHLIAHSSIGVVGLAILPGISDALVSSAKRGIDVYRAFKASKS